MKNLKKISIYIDEILTKWSLNYIDKVSRTLYPKPYLYENKEKKTTSNEKSEDDHDDDPILFI